MLTRRVLSKARYTRSFATATTETSALGQDAATLLPRQNKSPRPKMTTAVILTRTPIITRTPSIFERAYWAYQSRIQRALHNPFPSEFYFKQGSPLEMRFNAEEMTRERKAFGKPFGMLTAEEVEEGKKANTAEEDSGLQDEDEENVSRIHPSDISGDVKSLDRKGQRHLYLVVKTQDGWVFPEGKDGVAKGELLHETAERDLKAVCGPFMDTWIVSRQPIGVYNPSSPSTSDESNPSTFFYKAHILSGQVHAPKDNGVQDFAWLTKQEMEGRLEKDYWNGVKDMLSDF